MRHIESDHGKHLMQWAHGIRLPDGKRISEVMYHSPNGGKRNVREAARMKAEGVRSGIPDYHLPIPAMGYHSLYIELKKPDAVPSDASPDQRREALMLDSYGHRVMFAAGWNQASAIIQHYLSMQYSIEDMARADDLTARVFRLARMALVVV